MKRGVWISSRLLLLFSFLFVGHRVYAWILEDPFFQVRDVDVAGYQTLSRESLLSLAPVEEMSNIFTVPLGDVAKRFESHPWIEDVTVKKVFPNKLSIRIKERKPVALLQLEKLYYIDAKGVLFSPTGGTERYNYPLLTGLSRSALEQEPMESKRLITKALELLNLIEKEKVPPLTEVSEIRMEKSFGLCLLTQDEAVEVRMGWEDFEEKLRRLSIIWSDLRKRGVAVSLIDCSHLNSMVVRKVPRQEGPGRKGVMKRG